MLGLIVRLKNSDFMLESEMGELNQNKKVKQSGWIVHSTQVFTKTVSKSIIKFPRKVSC